MANVEKILSLFFFFVVIFEYIACEMDRGLRSENRERNLNYIKILQKITEYSLYRLQLFGLLYDLS